MHLPPAPVFDDAARPVVLAAFDGWADAGQAATAALEFLAEAGPSEGLGMLDLDDCYDYQVHRPRVVVEAHGPRFAWPGIVLTRTLLDGRELLLLRGPEPSVRWRSFTAALLAMVAPHDPAALLVLGAHLGRAPHTRPVPVEATSSDPGCVARGLAPARYQGPVGVGAVLAATAEASGLPTAQLWAVVPDYRAADPHLSAALALVEATGRLLGVSLPTGEFAAAAATERADIDGEVSADPDLADYVRELEEHHDTRAEGEEMVSEVERYLRGV